MICTICNMEFEGKTGARFCSQKCQKKAYRQTVRDNVRDTQIVQEVVQTKEVVQNVRDVRDVVRDSVTANNQRVKSIFELNEERIYFDGENFRNY